MQTQRYTSTCLRRVAWPGLLALLPALQGCQVPGYHAPVGADRIAAATPAVKIVPIGPSDLQPKPAADAAPSGADLQESNPTEYRLGRGDVVSITIWNHAEFAEFTDEQETPDASRVLHPTGQLISADGTVFFPYVGLVPAAGRTLNELREDLAHRLAAYLKNPQVYINVLKYRSQRVLVSGEVKSPGMIALTDLTPSLTEVISQAGGPTLTADLDSVTVTRAGRTRTLSLHRILDEGHREEDLAIRGGDVVSVGDAAANRVHVIGEVRLPSTYQMPRNGMSLADALGAAGGIDPVTANASLIMVLRREGTEAVAHVLDSRSAAGMVLAAGYSLQPQDVVYVAPVRFTDYNRMISQVLPSVQALWEIAYARQALVSPHYK